MTVKNTFKCQMKDKEMHGWTPENIAALCTAIAGVITATGAAFHSMNTRNRLNDHFEEHLDSDNQSKSNSGS